ncbi:MAG: membrane protein insertase YidC [Bifidobacteriaceae bacterium]|jgi:YidC/Oxa1 family membrane protein insertase|nr:membrane protein insertase YidC [Bifidobacteriaceae bacterium]
MGWFDAILKPIMWVVAWIMYGVHQFGQVIGVGNGVAWVLSIVVLVVIMRVIMMPLFLKQIRSSRGMQLLQPELQKIQKRYKGKTDPVSRRRMQEETMALYRKNGSNPMSGCWPVLAQSPLFFALFRTLYALTDLAKGNYKGGDSIGPIDQSVADDIINTHLFGAPLSATFLNDETWGGASPVAVRIVTVILIALMSVTTFTTQRQLTMKNMPASAMDNPMFRTQKMMMYMMPVIFAVSGVNFPIGVLIYWFTTNLWSMGQQFFVIRNMPAPGSEAETRLKERKAKKRLRKGLGPEEEGVDDAAAPASAPPPAQRVQPKRTSRAQRRSGPLQAANPSPGPDDPRREIEPSDAEPEGVKDATADGGSGKSVDNTGKTSGAAKSGSARAGGAGARTGKAGAASVRTGSAGARSAKPGRAGGGGSAEKTDASAESASGSSKPGGSTAGSQRQQPKKQSRKKRK